MNEDIGCFLSLGSGILQWLTNIGSDHLLLLVGEKLLVEL